MAYETQQQQGGSPPVTSTDGLMYPYPMAFRYVTRAVSVFVWVRGDVQDSFAKYFSIPWTEGSWNSPFLQLSFGRDASTSNGQFAYTDSGGAIHTASSDSGMIETADERSGPPGTMRFLGVTRLASTVTFYLNGLPYGAAQAITDNDQGFNGVTGITHVCHMNRSQSANGEALDGFMAGSYLYTRALSNVEVLELYRKPWSMVAQPVLVRSFSTPQTPAMMGMMG